MDPTMNQQAMQNLWNDIDVDGCGSVNWQNLYQGLSNYGFTPSKIQGLFNTMDNNSDGQVTYQEYLQALGMAQGDPLGGWRQWYRQMDTNRTGMIPSDEIMGMCDSMNPPIDKSMIQQWLADNDSNGNGMVDYQSFLNYLQQNAMGNSYC